MASHNANVITLHGLILTHFFYAPILAAPSAFYSETFHAALFTKIQTVGLAASFQANVGASEDGVNVT